MNENSSARLKGAGSVLPLGLAIALLAMLFPTSERIVGTQPWRVELLTTAVLFACITLEYWRDRNSVVRMFSVGNAGLRWIVLPLAGFAIWSLISSIWAQLPRASLHHAIVWTNYILYFLFIRHQISQSRGYHFIATVLLSLTGIISLLCLIDYVTLPDFASLESTLRMRYSKYAELLICALPFVWILGTYLRDRRNRLFVMAAGVAGWMTVMMSLSKGAFIAGIFGFAILFAGSLLFGSKPIRPRIAASLGLWLAVTLATQIGFTLFSAVPSTSEYITGSSGLIRESSIARMFVWNVGAQMAADNILKGVGANNFGVRFNESRADYRVKHPTSPHEEVLSEQIAERAHNEPLQVFAELGVVGLILLAIPAIFFGAMVLRTWAGGYRGTPVFWAALGGMIAFGASSMVSSFSFRLAQNGIIFFLIFAVAIFELGKLAKVSEQVREHRGYLAPSVVFGGVCLIMCSSLVNFGSKAVAGHYAALADADHSTEAASRLYNLASRLDPENGSIYLSRADRSRSEKDYAKAAHEQRIAIDQGLGIVLTYSMLVDDYVSIGDLTSAERTFKEAIRIFPRSVFLRVRYSFLLEDLGHVPEAAKQKAAAYGIDEAQAGGWSNILKNGSVSAFYAARSDPRVAAPVDLRPEAAVLLYLDKSPAESF